MKDGPHRRMHIREAYVNIQQPLKGAALLSFLGAVLDDCWDQDSLGTDENNSMEQKMD